MLVEVWYFDFGSQFGIWWETWDLSVLTAFTYPGVCHPHSCPTKAKLKTFANLLSLMGLRYVWEIFRAPCCRWDPPYRGPVPIWSCGELLFCSMLERAEDTGLLNLQVFLQCIGKFCYDSHTSWLCSGWIHSWIQGENYTWACRNTFLVLF